VVKKEVEAVEEEHEYEEVVEKEENSTERYCIFVYSRHTQEKVLIVYFGSANGCRALLGGWRTDSRGHDICHKQWACNGGINEGIQNPKAQCPPEENLVAGFV